ncbi:hypothetical protein [Pseudophaeobacter sp. 1A09344]|uniref:hypothetical protein n=1 Tax=Pseudophaeobacter sp. 1A09344 TaxID=3098144 RepID=UPI0034D52CE4
MSDASLDRFKEYSTSGSFNLALSRAQVSALAMIAEHGDALMGAHTYRALHHKGLVAEIQAEGGGFECRLTPAGVYALKLVRLADLVQGDPDPVGAEIQGLTRDLETARGIARNALLFARSMKARAEQAHNAVKRVRRFLRSGAPRPKPIISLKDPSPDLTLSHMSSALDMAERNLKGGQ